MRLYGSLEGPVRYECATAIFDVPPRRARNCFTALTLLGGSDISDQPNQGVQRIFISWRIRFRLAHLDVDVHRGLYSYCLDPRVRIGNRYSAE